MTPETRFRLLISGPQPPQEIPIPLGELTIGRQEGNQLRLNDSKVSRRHAVIECSASECQIIDLNSSNGTMCNGIKIDAQVRTQLLPGDTIKIGPFTLLIDLAGSGS